MNESNVNACSLDFRPKLSQNDKFIRKLRLMNPFVTENEIERLIPVIEQIREIKNAKDAIILSHYYMPAALQITVEDGGVADVVGDSLALSVGARKAEAKNIVFCGVRFMAETASLLNPGSSVYIPDMLAGCSLAESISGEQIRELKAKHPGVPVIAYINTYAETKAESDICVTSRNAMDIAKSFSEDTLIFLPDYYMGQNLASAFEKLGKKLILWKGSCEVHEQFRTNIYGLQAAYPEAKMLLHWEVPRETVSNSLKESEGVLGSTSDIIRYAGSSDSKQFILASECDLGATLKGMYPEKEFITPCISCRHMKRISPENSLEALLAIGSSGSEKYAVSIDPAIRERALLPVERMLKFI